MASDRRQNRNECFGLSLRKPLSPGDEDSAQGRRGDERTWNKEQCRHKEEP